MQKNKSYFWALLLFQLPQQLTAQLLVAGLAQQSEHVLLVRLHAGLVEGVHVQQVPGQAAGVLKEVDQPAQRLLVQRAGLQR